MDGQPANQTTERMGRPAGGGAAVILSRCIVACAIAALSVCRFRLVSGAPEGGAAGKAVMRITRRKYQFIGGYVNLF